MATDDTNRQHEIDRLRLLLQKATCARKALMVEIAPGKHGFRLIVTGITAEHENEAAQTIADYVNILMKGACRFTMASLEGLSRWRADDEGLQGTVTALATSPDAFAPVPEQPPSVAAVDPSDGARERRPMREKESREGDRP